MNQQIPPARPPDPSLSVRRGARDSEMEAERTQLFRP